MVAGPPSGGRFIPIATISACTAVGAWLDRASERDREQVLEALQVSVTATQERATVAGVLPLDDSQLPKPRVGLSPLNEHRHLCSMAAKSHAYHWR